MWRIIRYLFDVCIFHKRIGLFTQNKFGTFGAKSYIGRPLALKNIRQIYVGNNVSIASNSRLEVYCTNHIDPHIMIGNDVCIMYNVSILAGADIIIGDNVLIASNVLITSENHGIDPESDLSYLNQPLQVKPVIINDDVWIGEKSIILPGVEVGKGSIVAAGSVVTRSIEKYTMVAGNPAKVIKVYDFLNHVWKRKH